MSKIKVLKLDCLRCGHRWIPRKVIIKVCPLCKSPYWNVEKKGDKK